MASLYPAPTPIHNGIAHRPMAQRPRRAYRNRAAGQTMNVYVGTQPTPAPATHTRPWWHWLILFWLIGTLVVTTSHEVFWRAEHNQLPQGLNQYRGRILAVAEAFYPSLTAERFNAEVAQAESVIRDIENKFPGTTDTMRARAEFDTAKTTHDEADLRHALRTAEASYRTSPIELANRASGAQAMYNVLLADSWNTFGSFSEGAYRAGQAGDIMFNYGDFKSAEKWYLEAIMLTHEFLGR